MKSVVVIDTPNSCKDCPFFDDSHYTDIYCRAHPGRWSINYPIPTNHRQAWCPLKDYNEEDTLVDVAK